MSAGAYGGKLMGAGGGGFFMFLASPEQHERIKLAIPEINVWVPFKFDFEGSTIIME
jgi:D-glycero-alpha-D-manno-heptose-7-phosphate kinase